MRFSKYAVLASACYVTMTPIAVYSGVELAFSRVPEAIGSVAILMVLELAASLFWMNAQKEIDSK